MAKKDKSKKRRDGDDSPRPPPRPFGKIPTSYIAKGQMLRRMDRLAADPGVMRLALQALVDHPGTPMLEIGRAHRYVEESELEIHHVGADWFDTEAGWFRGHGPVEPVLRAGFIQAARVALESDPALPVDCYWMSNHDRIEVVVTRSPQQVTMILMTPQPQRGEFAAGEEAVEEDIWIVGMADDPSPVPGTAIQRVRVTE
jgi:hypothetical protein